MLDLIRFGKKNELLAKQYLTEKGYRIVTTNYRCRIGEIDLICFDHNCLVFVEVRSKRNGQGLIAPTQSMSKKKMTTIRRVAEHYLLQQNTPMIEGEIPMRFDFVGITGERTPHIEHIENAF